MNSFPPVTTKHRMRQASALVVKVEVVPNAKVEGYSQCIRLIVSDRSIDICESDDFDIF